MGLWPGHPGKCHPCDLWSFNYTQFLESTVMAEEEAKQKEALNATLKEYIAEERRGGGRGGGVNQILALRFAPALHSRNKHETHEIINKNKKKKKKKKDYHSKKKKKKKKKK